MEEGHPDVVEALPASAEVPRPESAEVPLPRGRVELVAPLLLLRRGQEGGQGGRAVVRLGAGEDLSSTLHLLLRLRGRG